MNVSLIDATLPEGRAFLAVLAMEAGRDIPAAAVLGTVEMNGDLPRWSTFRRNRTFSEAYARYMRGEASARPQILATARVRPGDWVYVIDPRTPDPEGHVPLSDVVGWYQSDAVGQPRPETFTYNAKHALVTADGRWSGIVEDDLLPAALRG